MEMSCVTLTMKISFDPEEKNNNKRNPKCFKKQLHHSFHSHLLFYLTKAAQVTEAKQNFRLANPNYYKYNKN